MKKLVLISVLTMFIAATAIAQKLQIGEKMPDLKIKEWIGKQPSMSSPMLIEFFHSSSNQCIARLEVLDKLTDKYKSKMDVILLSKEAKEVAVKQVKPEVRKFFIGLDDAGRTFTAYNVQFVPFSVLVDNKGRIAWFGNATLLTEDIINDVI